MVGFREPLARPPHMDQEEMYDPDPERPTRADQGFSRSIAEPQRAAIVAAFAAERAAIFADTKLAPRHKRRLLECNRLAMVNALGGSTRDTENVMRHLIVFAGLVTLVLASLTTFADLPAEVSLSFISTVAGGLIATVSQKIRQL